MLNEFYTNIGVKGFIKRYGFVNGIKRGIFTKFGIHVVKDYEMKKVLWQAKVYKKLEKYTDASNKNFIENLKFNDIVKVNNPIWIYWDSGVENAPSIVQSCIKSVMKNTTNEVVVLSEKTIEDYVKLPEWVKEKRKSDKLPMAHYTDIIRLALLYNYGGTWIDATVYLTGVLPDSIINSDFFALRNSFCLLDNPALYAVWFIHSKANNSIIKETLNASLTYWSKKNHVEEYLMTNLIMTIVIHKHGFDDDILYANTDYSEHLMKILGEKFATEKFEWIKKLTNIHKLSYKLDESIEKGDTYYSHIVKAYEDSDRKNES